MPERLAKDVMVPLERYATVYEDQSLKEAIDVLRNSLASGHRTLAVLNSRNDVVGFLTVRTILKALEIAVLEADAWTESWTLFFLRGRAERLKNIKVKEVMRPVVKVFVSEATPLQEVARTLLRNQVNHIPVLNRERKVVGIIRAIDVLDVLAELMEQK